MLFGLMLACTSTPPAPSSVAVEPAPAPVPPQPVIDISGAEPMEVVEALEPGPVSSRATFVFSSRGDGEIERCGCPKNPAGGLARRRTMLDALPPTRFLFDAGDSLGKHGTKPTTRTESKATLIADEWKRTQIDGIALGAGDWQLGKDFVLKTAVELPVLAANLVCEGGIRPFPAARIVEHGGRKVGVVGLTLGTIEGCVVTDPATAAREARSLLTDVDATVLLWPDRNEAAHSAGLQGLPYDFVVDASGRFGKEDAPFWAGTTWLVGAGIMTKAVARIDVEFQPGGEGFFPVGFAAQLEADEKRLDDVQRVLDQRYEPTHATYKSQASALRSRRTSLGNRAAAYGDGKVHRLELRTVRLTDDVEDHGATKERVEAVKHTFGTAHDASPSELIARPLVGPEGSVYAGAKACASCHAEQWSQWNRTPHARAIQTLLRTKNHGDDSCYGCHITGAAAGGKPAYDIVVTDPAEMGGLIQVQCEACHGPSRTHVDDPAVLPARVPGPGVCVGCHDGVRDEGSFDYATYLPKVAH